MIRARLPLVALGVLLALIAACQGRGPLVPDRKLVVLGFDGMDPGLVARWTAEGRLPALAALAAQGGLYQLATTPSPTSPSAWASFATGVNPGKHNIYGALVRDPATYRPLPGMVRRLPGRFLLDYFPVSKPQALSIRGGTSFWVVAGQAGIRSSILTVPVTYPPEGVPNGRLLSGLPLPDLRDTLGTYHYFATDLTAAEEGYTRFGGVLRRLVTEDDVAHTELEGPFDPIARQRIRELRGRSDLTPASRAHLTDLHVTDRVRLPMTVRWNRAAPERSATVEIQGQSVLLKPGQWSRWLHLEFPVNALIRLRGMVQMYLIDAGDRLQLYVSPVNWDPGNPPLPMAYPASFSEDLSERLGTYATLGWADPTWPLIDGRIDEKTFMDALYRSFDDRAEIILSQLGHHDWDLLVGVISSADRVQHVMWRLIDSAHPMYDPVLAVTFGPAVERIYRRIDQFVERAVDMIEPDTLVLIVSGHGFHSWRRAVNLNTWLVREGFMALRLSVSAEKTREDLFGDGQFWEHVDWSRTRAYAMGLGQIYFNLQGREVQGIVHPGAEYETLADELGARLLAMIDPATGTRIVRAVYARDDVYAGRYVGNAPDLQVGFADGYRVSWETMLGGAPPDVVYDNMSRWSGDHGGYDAATTPGVLISNRPVDVLPARIVDIAPTVLHTFGIPLPTSLDGRPLFR